MQISWQGEDEQHEYSGFRYRFLRIERHRVHLYRASIHIRVRVEKSSISVSGLEVLNDLGLSAMLSRYYRTVSDEKTSLHHILNARL
jgi:hypothetical protein